MTTRALVLGGGGPVGIAWETGFIGGLASCGVLLSEAELIIGTSAGSMVGAQLALGRSPESMLASQRALGEQTRKAASETGDAGPGSASMAELQPLFERMQKVMSGEGDAEALRREIGAFALAAKTMPEEQWLGTFGFLLGAEWPEKRFVATAVDAEDGSFKMWDRDSGLELGRAVASSCTVPGIFPPVLINGRRYIDGGMRSATNADLAAGYGKVVVVAVTAGANVPERLRAGLDRELEKIRESGEAELIVPGQPSVEAFGPNLMDGSRRSAAVEAGFEQGITEAPRLSAWWNAPA